MTPLESFISWDLPDVNLRGPVGLKQGGDRVITNTDSLLTTYGRMIQLPHLRRESFWYIELFGE